MLLNKDPSLLPLLLCLAAPRSHDTSHTFHPVIQHPMSPSQKGTPAVKRMSTACTRRSGEGCPPNTPLRFDKRKGCVRTYSMYSLLFSFVTIISDPLGFRSTWYVCNYKDKTTITIMSYLAYYHWVITSHYQRNVSKIYSELFPRKWALCPRERLMRPVNC